MEVGNISKDLDNETISYPAFDRPRLILAKWKKHMQSIVNIIDFGDVFPLSNHDLFFFHKLIY